MKKGDIVWVTDNPKVKAVQRTFIVEHNGSYICEADTASGTYGWAYCEVVTAIPDPNISAYVCVDFDGTIVGHEYPQIGKPVPGALEWLKKFKDRGIGVILFTMRSDEMLQQAVDYLAENDIQLFGINHNPTQSRWTNSPKAYGHIYVDDAAVGCPLITIDGFARPCVDWSIVGPEVERLLTF